MDPTLFFLSLLAPRFSTWLQSPCNLLSCYNSKRPPLLSQLSCNALKSTKTESKSSTWKTFFSHAFPFKCSKPVWNRMRNSNRPGVWSSRPGWEQDWARELVSARGFKRLHAGKRAWAILRMCSGPMSSQFKCTGSHSHEVVGCEAMIWSGQNERHELLDTTSNKCVICSLQKKGHRWSKGGDFLRHKSIDKNYVPKPIISLLTIELIIIIIYKLLKIINII